MEAGVKERTLDIVRVVMGKPLREEASPDGTTQLIAGDPGEVVVTVSKERVSVFEYAIGWQGPGTLTLYLARSEGRERYFGCNLMHRKVLASSHQHLMAEAPLNLLAGVQGDLLAIGELVRKGRTLAACRLEVVEGSDRVVAIGLATYALQAV